MLNKQGAQATYLVTGGCGFIGSHLVEALINLGHNIIVLDNLSSGKRQNIPSKTEVIVGDICDIKLVQEVIKKVDGCFHLAANVSVQASNEDWLGTHQVNLSGTINIFNAAKHGNTGKPVPVVYASSCAVYGDNANLPLTETATPMPLSAYAADKLGCEMHARVGWYVHHVPSIGLRLFNIYGTRQNLASMYSAVIPAFLDELNHNEPEIIYGDGKQTRDFIYVKDAVNFFIKSMEKLQNNHDIHCDIYNVCRGKSTSINDLATLLAQLTHKPANITHTKTRPGDVRNSLGSPEKALKHLGLEPQYSLREGLEELIRSRKKD